MPPSKLVIAIDGPAGSGKSTTARAVASRLGLAHLDSGSLYRAVTYLAIEEHLDLASESALTAIGERVVRLEPRRDTFVPLVAGRDVSALIREDRVTARVSEVAAVGHVREWVTAELRRAARDHERGVVVDGRDIGTVVFPDADLKVFLTASVNERAKRRALESGRQPDADHVTAVAQDIEARDRADSSRAVAPLRRAPDAHEVDTTALDFEGQVETVAALARKLFR